MKHASPGKHSSGSVCMERAGGERDFQPTCSCSSSTQEGKVYSHALSSLSRHESMARTAFPIYPCDFYGTMDIMEASET